MNTTDFFFDFEFITEQTEKLIVKKTKLKGPNKANLKNKTTPVSKDTEVIINLVDNDSEGKITFNSNKKLFFVYQIELRLKRMLIFL